MRVILLHNPKAGNGTPSANALKYLFAKAGHEIVYGSTEDTGWEQRIAESADAVAIAGGDGTVGLVALRVAQRGLPFALLPLGTANNVARSLGEKRRIEEIVGALSSAEERPIDMGTISTRMGSRPFLESVGAGVMVELIRASTPKRKKRRSPEVNRAALKRLVKIADRHPGVECKLRLDGETLSGRYLLLEIMNAAWIGHNLPLATGSAMDDGMFDVICVRVDRRNEFEKYLERMCATGHARPPARARRCRRVELECAAGELHVDDEVLDVAVAQLEVDRAALRVLGIR